MSISPLLARSSRVLSRTSSRLISRYTPSSPSSSSSIRSLVTPTSSGSSSNGKSSSRKYLPYALIGIPASLLIMPTISAESPSDEDKPVKPLSSLEASSLSSLIRSYLVYTLICTPGLVDYSPTILHSFTHSFIPGLKGITEYIVRLTFFGQFVPGETVEECLPTMSNLHERGVGSMLNYSAEADLGASPAEEVDLEEQAREERLQEVFRALQKSGEFEKSLPERDRGATSFALKVTGLIDPPILTRASTTLLRCRPLTYSAQPISANSPPQVPYPGTPQSTDARIVARDPSMGDGKELLSLNGVLGSMGVLNTDEGLRKGDLEELSNLWGKLKKIGQAAKDNGIVLLVDAEYTWMQPALDAYTTLLSAEFNIPPPKGSEEFKSWRGPLIYGTYQSYLTRQPTHLIAALKHAEDNGYALGIKLVRGAYFDKERKKWKNEGREGADPIWPDKSATDSSYNGSLNTVISTLSTQLASKKPELALSVIFGTHNPDSCDLICDGLKQVGLATELPDGRLQLREDVQGKVGVAQLYGMKDDLTDKMAAKFVFDGRPIAIKYIAYGKLAEVMPFLGRRAIENKSLMSGDQGAAAERRRVGSEIWRRMF
ncbi:uncharacterized protein I206_105647 [Kwoniella pini CBS 10737]|uniref:Proline dehydrogenase n=1 Tax=Kwoniella pini CBS 10737 TaxID=1296096 RepID=A0A1B9I3M7_9TREE|nr:uncharacterized protein I206_03453 [Kwoniella pini CBS 10737]OCF50134.1 hypothetical protein I206_03453 [Kwoniella pini CBS 10737]